MPLPPFPPLPPFLLPPSFSPPHTHPRCTPSQNLGCLLDELDEPSFAEAATFRNDYHYVGHLLKENGERGALFLSGAAGYVMSRTLVVDLIRSLEEGKSPSCTGSKRERSQPGLLLAKCIRSLGAVPRDSSDAGGSRFNVYGPARLVTGR